MLCLWLIQGYVSLTVKQIGCYLPVIIQNIHQTLQLHSSNIIKPYVSVYKYLRYLKYPFVCGYFCKLHLAIDDRCIADYLVFLDSVNASVIKVCP